MTPSTPYTLKKLSEVADAAPGFGIGDFQEVRFANDALETERTGFTHHLLGPGKRPPFAHRHEEAEEVYVVLAGAGRVKLDDEILELAKHDAPRRAEGDPSLRGRPRWARAARLRTAPQRRRRGDRELVD